MAGYDRDLVGVGARDRERSEQQDVQFAHCGALAHADLQPPRAGALGRCLPYAGADYPDRDRRTADGGVRSRGVGACRAGRRCAGSLHRCG